MQLDRTYWESRYHNGETGWDTGSPTPPLKAYLDQLTDKNLRIFFPGAGRAWEAEYAHRQGFKNVFVIDLTDTPFKDLLARCPDFPQEHLITGDFFGHKGRYDRIIEQTFFCALDPALRPTYVKQMHALLHPGGRLVGVVFDTVPNAERPPFGGSEAEYLGLFGSLFPDVAFERCYNSIFPRAGRELWVRATRSRLSAPIDCSLYDHFEAAATLKETVLLRLCDGSEHKGIIVDLFVRDHIEWLRSKDGREIRLDEVTDLQRPRHI